MTDRKTASTINDAQLDQLYAALAALREVARGYCPACGRGDAAPSAADWEQQRQRADRLAATLREALDAYELIGLGLDAARHARWRAALGEPGQTPTRAAQPRTCLLADDGLPPCPTTTRCATCDKPREQPDA